MAVDDSIAEHAKHTLLPIRNLPWPPATALSPTSVTPSPPQRALVRGGDSSWVLSRALTALAFAASRQALLIAAQVGDAGTIRVLLDNEASLDHYNGKNRSPLEVAAVKGHCEACEVLIKHGGARPDARDLKGSTPLHMACQNGSVAIVEMMLATASSPAVKETLVNLPRDDGVTPIVIAVHNNSMALLELLLSHGADASQQARRGAPTALHGAVQGGHVEMTRRLLDLGLDVNAEQKVRNPSDPFCDGAVHGAILLFMPWLAHRTSAILRRCGS